MKKSVDDRVTRFLDDIGEVEVEKHKILQFCRDIVFCLNPDVGERIMYGGIMFSVKGDDIGGIFVSKKHVSFEFTNGYKLADPKGLLEGKGKKRRHLKLKSETDVDAKCVKEFVKQVI